MKNWLAPIKVAILIVVMGCAAAPVTSSSPSPSANSSTAISPIPTSSSDQNSVSVDIVAHNISFNLTDITVPAGAAVTVNFNNEDVGIPHNFAVYQNLPGGQTKPIFIGTVINGPATIIYHFTAPTDQGSYFFECDVHPQTMNGKFIIAKSQ